MNPCPNERKSQGRHTIPGIRVTKLPPRWLMPLSTFKGQTYVLIRRRSECIDGIKEVSLSSGCADGESVEISASGGSRKGTETPGKSIRARTRERR